MPTKFWTVVEGVVGTAHINRNGAVVDFRATEYTSIESDFVFVACPKGQENLPEVTEFRKWGQKGASFPFTITEMGLSDGSTPFVIVKEVEIIVNQIPVLIQHEGSRLVISTVTTPESLALHEEWKLKEVARKEAMHSEYKARIKAQTLASEQFINSFPSLYEGMSGAERRWVRRFVSNSQKARDEVMGLLSFLDNKGMEGFKATHCTEYGDSFSAILSAKLGEVLELK